MKKIFTLFFLLSMLFCSSQPVFQASLALSVYSGSTGTVLIGNRPSSPGLSGAGVTWDFSTISFTPAGTATFTSSSQTPFYSSFGSLNASVMALSTGTFYNYVTIQLSDFNLDAESITATGGSTYTPDPKKILTFPLIYGSSYTDSYQCTTCSPSSFTVTYDAYGTLIINGKTYNNVARVTKQYGSPYYDYYNTNPIFSIFSYDSNPLSSPTSTLIESSMFSGINENYVVEHMSVYPNPAKGSMTLQNNNFIKVDFALFDLLGKELKTSQQLNQGEMTKIDISNYPSGLYFIRYHDEFGNDSYAKLVIE